MYNDLEAFDRDKCLMEDFHSAKPEEKLGIVRQMSDERFRSFARRIIYENFQQTMNENEIEEFKERINDRLNAGDDVPWTTLDQAILDCDELFETAAHLKMPTIGASLLTQQGKDEVAIGL